MSVFTNKHLVVAMLVAPVLAVLAYFALDALISEPPQPAEAGQSYPLVEKPNCRYGSGRCGLKNGDFELVLSTRALGDDRLSLNLKSVFPLDGVMIAVVEEGRDQQRPVAMQSIGDDGLDWSLDMRRSDPERHSLRLVSAAKQSNYYGDAATKFTLYEIGADGQF
jgi:hypothetical protein